MKFLAKKIFLSGLIIGAASAGFLGVLALSVKIPDFNALLERKIVQSTKIYDQSGKTLLYDVHQDIKRTLIPFSKIPRHIKNATVAIEDDNFYYHWGIDFFSIGRAFIANFTAGKITQGGSTITQQLVKNSFLTPERTLTRKLKELILTLKIEKQYSKEKILELYLNEIPYGLSSYGIEAAAQTFFAKNAEDLDLAQAAYLAALPKAPSYYSPYGYHQDELEKRKNLVLERMAILGFISQEEKEAGQKEKVEFLNKNEDETMRAPHFTIMVKKYLEEKYGEEMVSSGGLKVDTTLNWDFQKKAEKIVKQYAEENKNKFNAFNAALAAIDPKTGAVLAIVGSKDYFAEPEPKGCSPGVNCFFEGNFNAALARRQPGSAFKPFAYATAFKKGYTPETALFDLPTEFNPDCDPDVKIQEKITAEILAKNPDYEDKCYHPINYDNIFRGTVTMREALAQSINLPSVKTLYLAGLTDTIKTAREMGITTLTDPQRYGLTLVLGGGEVKLLEMVGAYAVFANDGVKTSPYFIKKVESADGKILEEHQPEEKRILDEQVARLINDVLSDNKARTPAFGENSWLYFPDRPVAAKTGTTNDYRDAWIIGYAPNFALGAWVGNNNNSAMEKKVAGFIVAPMWNAFMKEVLKELPKEEFKKAKENSATKPVLKGRWQGGEIYFIDKISKKLATNFTPPETIEEKILTQIHSILYWLDKNNPLGSESVNPENDPQFKLWEFPIRKWAAAQNISEETNESLPKEFDDVHKPEYQPKINLIFPKKNELVSRNNFYVKTEIQSYFKIIQVDFFLDGIFLGSKKMPPYELSYDFTARNYFSEKANLIIKAYDEAGNKKILEYPFVFEK
ncbi:MAG: PBP1A family penicillin-binding protein [Candidatus Niyogibacteria bacterium]|nr:PBP1A family penicillin-binding protein [Candidatus Niyogibacteria bacterium]